MTTNEVLEALIREAGEHKTTVAWTRSDDNLSSCMTVRIPIALINRAREALRNEAHERISMVNAINVE